MWYKSVNFEKFGSPETPIESPETTLHELKAIQKLDSTSAICVPLVMWYETLYTYGLLPVYLFTDTIYPKLYISTQLPFVPSMMTSYFYTIAVLWPCLVIYIYFLQIKCYKVIQLIHMIKIDQTWFSSNNI